MYLNYCRLFKLGRNTETITCKNKNTDHLLQQLLQNKMQHYVQPQVTTPEIQFRVHPRLPLGWNEFCRHLTSSRLKSHPFKLKSLYFELWIKKLDGWFKHWASQQRLSNTMYVSHCPLHVGHRLCWNEFQFSLLEQEIKIDKGSCLVEFSFHVHFFPHPAV